MRSIILIAAILFSNVIIFAQNGFQAGYFIDNEGKEVECLIKNMDWKNNPSSFKYKLSESAPIQIASIEDIKEFGIPDFSKYKRFTLNLARSSNLTDKLTEEKTPTYQKETIFLRVLIEGGASLYVFEDKNILQFYYQQKGKAVEHLVYKEYLSPNDGSILENNTFKSQLFHNLNCNNGASNGMKNTKYQEKSLIQYFTTYNQCTNTSSINYSRKKNKKIAFSFRPGINFSLNEFDNVNILGNVSTTKIGNGLGWRVGIDTEFFLSFNNNRWSIMAEPTYSIITMEETVDGEVNSMNLKMLELPFGLRHYLPINNQSRAFLNLGLTLTNNLNSEVILRNSTISVKRISSNFFGGIGLKLNEKIGFECRYTMSRSATGSSNGKSFFFTGLSFVGSYTFYQSGK